MKTKKILTAFGVSAALLVGLTARQAAAAQIIPTVSACKGTIHGIGAAAGNFNAVSQAAVVGVNKTCVSLAGQYSFNLADGSGFMVNYTGEVDSGGGCSDISAVQPNGTKSTPGQGFVVWGKDPSGGTTPLTGCTALFTLTAFESLTGATAITTFPLSGPCQFTGATGISQCVARAQ